MSQARPSSAKLSQAQPSSAKLSQAQKRVTNFTVEIRQLLNLILRNTIPPLRFALFISTLVLISTTSCTKETSTDNIIDKPLSNPNNPGTFFEVQEEAIILGNKLPNPYNITVMTTAANKINHNLTITPNYYYVRFLPSNIDELSTLLDVEGLDLFDYPLDYEITKEGDYYQDPAISDENITYQYCTVSINYPFNNGINFEILDTLYLPDETTQGEDIEDEAFNIVGLANEKSSKAKARHYPEGTLRVWNTVTNAYEGVKNVRVFARNWFKIGSDMTDGSGHFYINKRFVGAKVTVEFKNSHTNLKTIPGARFWRIAYCSRIFLNNYNKIKGSDLTTISLNLNINSDLSTRGARDWSAATTNNAIEDMIGLCNSENIPCNINHLNVFAINWNNLGAAPMFKKMANSTILDDFIYLNFGFASAPLLMILEQYLPDVLIGYGDGINGNTLELNKLVFHEFGHSIHYNQVGNSWWMSLIYYETISHQGDYGTINSSNSGYAAIAESWSYFLEEYFCYLKFSPNDFNLYLQPLNINGVSFGWIPEGLPLDLYDSPENYSGNNDLENINITDGVEGITPSQYFSHLTTNNIEMHQIKNELMNDFPLQAQQIEILYSNYGF